AGSLNTIVLTGPKGQAIPGFGGRDYVPVIVTGGSLTATDPATGSIPIRIGQAYGFIEESANRSAGSLDVSPFATGSGFWMLNLSGTATLPGGYTKTFTGNGMGTLDNVPPLDFGGLQSPTIWQALRTAPSDTACNGDCLAAQTDNNVPG